MFVLFLKSFIGFPLFRGGICRSKNLYKKTFSNYFVFIARICLLAIATNCFLVRQSGLCFQCMFKMLVIYMVLIEIFCLLKWSKRNYIQVTDASIFQCFQNGSLVVSAK